VIDDCLELARPLERTALLALRSAESYPALPRLERSEVVLRLLRFEGLGSYTVWLATHPSSTCRVRRLIWDRAKTFERGAVEPLMYGSDAAFPGEALAQSLVALRHVTLPPFVAVSAVGTDGVHFGVECGTFQCSACLYWWSEAPGSWRQLESWFLNAIAEFDNVLPAHR